MTSAWFFASVGGALIGVSASLLLLFNGRVLGISGVLSGLLHPKAGETSWRVAFLVGLFSGAILLFVLRPEVLPAPSADGTMMRYVVAGFLVGFGTLLGNGCTSGHGVCGVSRLSVRSIVATLVFIFTAMVTVYFVNPLEGGF